MVFCLFEVKSWISFALDKLIVLFVVLWPYSLIFEYTKLLHLSVTVTGIVNIGLNFLTWCQTCSPCIWFVCKSNVDLLESYLYTMTVWWLSIDYSNKESEELGLRYLLWSIQKDTPERLCQQSIDWLVSHTYISIDSYCPCTVQLFGTIVCCMVNSAACWGFTDVNKTHSQGGKTKFEICLLSWKCMSVAWCLLQSGMIARHVFWCSTSLSVWVKALEH